MSSTNPPMLTDLIGPPLRAVPLSPVAVQYFGLPSAPVVSAPQLAVAPAPVKPSPRFLQERTITVSRWVPRAHRALGLASIFVAELLGVFAFRSNPHPLNALIASLTAFLVWIGYFAVPGLPEAMPLASVSGVGYLAILVPGSLFAAAVILTLGRGLGWCMERISSLPSK